MSVLGDFANKIKNLFSRLTTPRLSAPVQNFSYDRDLILESQLNKNNMNHFENPNNYNEYCVEYFRNPVNFSNQYDYVDVISQMKANGAMDDFKNYLSFINQNIGLYYPSEVHGVSHTSRVTFLAEMLASIDGLSEHDRRLLMISAELHDIGREDDRKRFDHGAAGSVKIDNLKILDLFSDLTDRDKDIIKFAVATHSLEPEQVQIYFDNMKKSDVQDYKRILDYLQDADKLDRARIDYNITKGAGVDPNRLASQTAKRLLKVAHQNFYEYNRIIEYEYNSKQKDYLGLDLLDYFNEIRDKLGYNITFNDFKNILSEFKPGTIEMLKQEDRLEDLFSYDTFLKYRKEENLDDRLKYDVKTKTGYIDPNKLFEDVNKHSQTTLLKQTFDKDFMLYYNLKKNNPEAFEILCYVDVDISSKYIAGLAQEVQINDLSRFLYKGYQFRLNDIFLLGSKIKPEQYRNLIDSNKIEDLFNAKYVSDDEFAKLNENLAREGIFFTEEDFYNNFKLIEQIHRKLPNIFNIQEIRNYSIPEIFTAITKLEDAKYRNGVNKVDDYNITSDIVFAIMNHSRNIVHAGMSEREILEDVANVAKNIEFAKNPYYIEYVNKKNKPYKAQTIEEINNYKEFCADNILTDYNISLEEAKRTLINVCFDIDWPQEYSKQMENEVEERLYYYQKYMPNSDLSIACGDCITKITSILKSKTIEEFKEKLFKNKADINRYNTGQIGKNIEKELIDYSRENIVRNLSQTAEFIKQKPYETVITKSNEPVQVKRLSGEKFYLATFTAMPNCSNKFSKLMSNAEIPIEAKRNMVYDELLNRPIVPSNVCTTISSDEMIAHLKPGFEDMQLNFACVPASKEDISISARHDLSSSFKGNNYRSTSKVTTPRNIRDLISTTTEEHNETVMSCFPDFIVCYDEVSDVAVKKRDILQSQARSEGFDKKIDIVLVDSKDKYLPKIKQKVIDEHNAILTKLNQGKLTENDFRLMFERPESNFVLRTLQAIHSTSYSDSTWDVDFADKVLLSATDILAEISESISPQYARPVLNQVNILLERADDSSGYGKNFYDHSYAGLIRTNRLKAIQEILTDKAVPYEQGISVEEYMNIKQNELNRNGEGR